SADAAEDDGLRRAQMVAEIEQMTRQTSDFTKLESLDTRVIEVMQKVPRHEFVPLEYQQYAYLNRPLPIGDDQTISQPYIVALMTHLAAVDKDSVVLEVGTGSGYQAAVLAELVAHVYTIEIIEHLGRTAEAALNRTGYDNITLRIGDGYAG